MGKSELKTTAELAKIDLSGDEEQRFSSEVHTMLEYFDTMAAAEQVLPDTGDAHRTVERRWAILRDAGALRPDTVRSTVDPDTLLGAAEELEDRFIVIPNVL